MTYFHATKRAEKFGKILPMKPEQGQRRAIIREWMSLSRKKRQTVEQAAAFATKAIEAHKLHHGGDRHQRVLAWLLPRTGKA